MTSRRPPRRYCSYLAYPVSQGLLAMSVFLYAVIAALTALDLVPVPNLTSFHLAVEVGHNLH